MSVRERLGLISLDYASAGECVAEARRRGLGHVELFVDHAGCREELAQLTRKDRLGPVRVHALSCLVKLGQAEEDLPEQLELLRDCVRLAARHGVPNVGFMYGGSATLGRLDARDRFLERLEPVADLARESGVRLLVENVFSRSPAGDLDSVDTTRELLRRVDPDVLGLTFDAANYTIGGEEAFPYAYQRLGRYIGAVHLKDVTRYHPEAHGPQPECRPLLDHRRGRHITVPLGDGALNALGLARCLIDEAGTAPVLLEPFRSGASREQWLDVSLDRLERLAQGGAGW